MHNSLIVKISQEHNIMNTIYESHRTFDKCITAIDKSGETRTWLTKEEFHTSQMTNQTICLVTCCP